jgi:D-xylose transport system permease protein
VIVRLGVPSFIMTLAGLMYLSGLAFIISNGFVLSGTGQSFYKVANDSLPHSATLVLGITLGAGAATTWLATLVSRRRQQGVISDGRFTMRPVSVFAAITIALVFAVFFWSYASFNGLPYIIAVLGVAAVMMWFIGHYTAFGRHLYAIGGNPEAARRAGISVGRIIVMVFVVAGFLAALGGVLQASRLDAASPDVGNLVPLNAISAAVVGGTSLFGGRGSILGTLLGALILGSILNGLSLMNVNTYYQYIAIGWILVAAVAVDAAAARRTSHE